MITAQLCAMYAQSNGNEGVTAEDFIVPKRPLTAEENAERMLAQVRALIGG